MSDTILAVALCALLFVIFGLVPYRGCTGHCAGCTGSCGRRSDEGEDDHA
jgi:hypothetical protein